MAFQEEPPQLGLAWLDRMFDSWRSWLKRKQVYSSAHPERCKETPRGIDLDFDGGEATTLKPLTLIADNSTTPARLRVVLGGFWWGGAFWLADLAMNAAERGTVANPYFYITGFPEGTSYVWCEMVQSWDGNFHRASGLTLEFGAVTPPPDTETAFFPLGTVLMTAGVLSVTTPQMLIDNKKGYRIGLPVDGEFMDDIGPLNS